MSNLWQRWLDRIAPPLTIRRQFLLLVGSEWRALPRDGVGAVVGRIRAALARYRQTGTLYLPQAKTEMAPAHPAPPPYPYTQWIADHEPDSETLHRQASALTTLAYHPLISIVTPVYNPPADVLAAAIESVLDQTYPHWTLCLVNGGSTTPGVHELLDRYAAQDRRIKVLHLDQNLGISGNSNMALQMATGEFVALLDHDDLLAPDMLFSVVELLNRHPDTDIVYFDEDKVSADGTTRSQPWFKPQWSPDLMLSTNLLMHSIMRRSLVEELHGFDPAMDGAQDWDLALRCAERTHKIRHIPRVFYHWRQIEGSAALDANAKPWAYEAQERCIKAHLERMGASGASVTFPSLGTVRIHWPVGNAKISIIIPNKDKVDLLSACLNSIFDKSTYTNYEIVLIDTGSVEPATADYYAALRIDPRVRLIEYDDQGQGGFNYSRANNQGAAAASGELLLFLNNDTEVLEPSWLEEMAGWALRPEVGVVGAKLLRPNGAIQHAGIIMGMAGHGSHVFEDGAEGEYGPFGSPEWVRNYQAVTGACMMMRREVFEELGGLDEVYQLCYSDIELCLRAVGEGYRVVYTPFARLLHHEGGSRGYSVPVSDVVRAACQMIGPIAAAGGDPYYNPNLSYLYRKPTPAQPDEAPPHANLVRVLESFDIVPKGAAEQPDSVAARLVPPPDWPFVHPPAGPDSRRKLLLVTHDLSLSGAPLLLAHLAARLVREGYSVTAISPEDGPVHELYTAAGAEVAIVPGLGKMLVDASYLTEAVAAHDLIFANTLVAWRAIHLARAYAKPSILWIHESRYGRDTAQANPPVGLALQQAAQVILPAQALVELYQPFLVEGHYTVLPYGIETAALRAASALLLPPASQSSAQDDSPDADARQRLRVVHIGSIEARKGQDFLLQSLADLPAQERDLFEVHLVGRTLDPDFERSLAELANSLPNVHFAGEVSHAQTLAYLRSADIFVLSSRDEVLPVSMLEAMFYRKAIIATDVGGVAEAIEDGVNGILIDFGDRKQLTGALTALAKNRSLLKVLGQNAYLTFLQRYAGERFGDAVVEILRSLLGSAPAQESLQPQPEYARSPRAASRANAPVQEQELDRADDHQTADHQP